MALRTSNQFSAIHDSMFPSFYHEGAGRQSYAVTGMSAFAKTNVLRGILTIRSSAPRDAEGGRFCATSVMSSANNREIAIVEFPDVGASKTAGRNGSIGVRISAESFSKYDIIFHDSETVPIGTYHVKPFLLYVCVVAQSKSEVVGFRGGATSKGERIALRSLDERRRQAFWIVTHNDQPHRARTATSHARYIAPDYACNGY